MKRCIFILPWFGPLRNYFGLFLRTCASNAEYDWLIITDHDVRNAPQNVRVLQMSFEELRRNVQSKFDFELALDTPYKLCDFKPAFGYLFEEQITGYEYWGHCDCDMLFGQLASLLEPLFDVGYDKIFGAGHMTLYKNTRENSRRFLLKDSEGVPMFRLACSHDGVFAFDEAVFARSVHTLFLEQGAKVYEKDLAFNVSTRYFNLRREALNPANQRWEVDAERPKAVWLDSFGIAALYRTSQGESVRRYTYIHLQGRKMQLPDTGGLGEYIQVLPDRFVTVGVPKPGSEVPSGLRRDCSWGKAAVQTLRRTKHRIFDADNDPHAFDPYAPYL